MKQLIVLLAICSMRGAAAQKVTYAGNIGSKKNMGIPVALPSILKGKGSAGISPDKVAKAKSANPAKKITSMVLVAEKKLNKKVTRKLEAPDSLVNMVKGNLHLPFSICSVQQPYGHMDMGTYKLYNPGISFMSPAPVAARACFDAIVEKVVELDGMYVVITSCQQIYFGYSNLDEVFVSKGDSVKTGTPLGTIGMDETGNYTLLFLLQIGEKEKDPKGWFNRTAGNLQLQKEWE